MSLINMMSFKELEDCIKILKENVTENVFKYGYYDKQTQQASKRLELYKRYYDKVASNND